MTTATNREQYKEAWQDYIEVLADMFTTADAEYYEWDKARSGLYKVLDNAADNAFPKPTMTGTIPSNS